MSEMSIGDVMETDRVAFLWEKFTEEPVGAVQQIIHIWEQIVFWEQLTPLLSPDEAALTHAMDVDLRAEGMIEPLYKEITIYTDWVTEDED